MFSPILAMVSAIASAIGDAADLGGLDLLDVGADVERDVGDHLHQALEQIVAGDEIGLRIDLDHDALGALERDRRPGLRRRCGRPSSPALASPFLRSKSTAASMSPAVSPSAALQSIMPAPVCSRSSLTICAVMLAIALSFSASAPARRSARLAASCCELGQCPRLRRRSTPCEDVGCPVRPRATRRSIPWPARSSLPCGRADQLPRRSCERRRDRARRSASNGRCRDR